MNEDGMKLVEFDKHCMTCKYEKIDPDDQPCDDCLTEAVNLNSHKPVYWEEKEK